MFVKFNIEALHYKEHYTVKKLNKKTRIKYLDTFLIGTGLKMNKLNQVFKQTKMNCALKLHYNFKTTHQ